MTADVPGLLCAASCTTTWNAGQRLALTATPAPGSRLVRWSGACSGTAGCNVTVAPGASVGAVFAPASFRLTVAVGGRGGDPELEGGHHVPAALLGVASRRSLPSA